MAVTRPVKPDVWDAQCVKEIPIADSRHRSSATCKVLIGAAALFGLQPIFADSLWWHVARGREALNFNMLPSASLLVADVVSESDWLSGVATALSFDLAGLHGVMVLQVSLSVLVAVSLTRAAKISGVDLKAWMLLPALTVLCNRSMPVPSTLTLLAIPVVWNAARAALRESTATQLTRFFVSCVLAVNLAPCVFWLLLTTCMVGVLRDDHRSGQLPRFALFRIAISLTVAVCVNPRGIFSIRDAVVLAFPQLVVSRAYLTGTHFDVLASSEQSFVIALFLVLSVLVVATCFRQRGEIAVLSCFASLQFCAWSCAGSLLPVTVLLVLLGAACSAAQTTVVDSSRRSRRWNISSTGFVTSAGLLVAVCVLGLTNSDRRLGWGVAPHLDYRPLERDLGGLRIEGTVLTDDLVGAGAVALLRLPAVTTQDTPERALLGGRWISRWHLWDDVSHQRRNPYERDDGTTGGWWSTLQNDDVKLLVINSQHHRSLRALETTSWRMLSLDSPVIPYGFSGEPAMAAPILKCWGVRWLVNYGRWQYDFPGAAVDWGRTDFIDALGGNSLTDECRRLAGVFETLELHHASIKVLTAALSVQDSAAVENQLQESLRHLARTERTLASRASRWSTWLAINSGDEKTTTNQSLILQLGFPPKRILGVQQVHFETLAVSDFWKKARSLYLGGRLDQAMKVLDSDDPASIYARAQLQIELGQTDAAIETLQRLEDSEIDPALHILVAHELRSVQRN